MIHSDPGTQLAILEPEAHDLVVNVASVPQRSPFRYPGGKTWLVPRIRQWLGSVVPRPRLLVEPFAGGGIVGLTAAFENLADHVVLVELDEQVAAVWQTILEGNAEWLADRILAFDLTEVNVRATLDRRTGGIKEAGFRTILKNRTFHGGILAPGSNLLKYGENGKGLRSRWYPETLAKRIRAIGRIRHKFTFIHGDGIEVMRMYARRKNAAFFVDPPYTVEGKNGKRAGTRLYVHHEVDHKKVFSVAAQVSGSILLTYDNAPEVRSLADASSFEVRPIPMKNTHHAQITELLISQDLSWMHRSASASSLDHPRVRLITD